MTKIYLNYDQQALDKEYNLRPLVPHHPQVFDRYLRDSNLVTAKFPCVLDIAYGSSISQRLDIFSSSNGLGPKPVLVFIHGGYWRNKDKEDYRYLAPAYTSAGVHFVLLNYTLAPKASMDEIVRDNQSALLWLFKNIENYKGDPNRIYIVGHSAGGHLVAMLLATDWSKFSKGEITKSIIKGGTSISGIFDLEPIMLSYLNSSLNLDECTVKSNSPIYLTPFSDIPFILTLGGEETKEYHRQQENFHAAWSKYISDMTVLNMPGLNHYDVVDHLSMPGSALYNAVFDQIVSDGK